MELYQMLHNLKQMEKFDYIGGIFNSATYLKVCNKFDKNETHAKRTYKQEHIFIYPHH